MPQRAGGCQHGQVKAVATLFKQWCFAFGRIAFPGGMLGAQSQFIHPQDKPFLSLGFLPDAGILLLQPFLYFLRLLFIGAERWLLISKTPALQ